MKIKIVLAPSGKKNLNDTIADTVHQKVDNLPLKAGILVGYKLAGIFGDSGTNTALSLVRGIFEKIAKDNLHKNHIYADVKKLTVEKNGEKLDVTLEAENILYSKSITENFQRIMDGLKKLPEDHIVIKVLDTLQDDKAAVVSALLDAVSEEKKEAIIKLLVGEFHEKLCSFIAKLLSDNNIQLTVKTISLY